MSDLTKADCYKAVSDLISDSYDWLSDEKNKDAAIQYVLGMNDLARCLAEKIEREYSTGAKAIPYKEPSSEIQIGDIVEFTNCMEETAYGVVISIAEDFLNVLQMDDANTRMKSSYWGIKGCKRINTPCPEYFDLLSRLKELNE